MAAKAVFDPLILNLGFFSPGQTKPFANVGAVAPVATTMTAFIVTDTSEGGFQVAAMSSSILVDVDPNDPDFPTLKGTHPRGKTLQVLDWSDGTRPIDVREGSTASVDVRFLAPDPPTADAYSATLVVATDAWDPVRITLLATTGAVATRIITPDISGDQGAQIPAAIEVRSIAGPATDVRYELAPFLAGISLTPTVVHVEPHSTAAGELTFTISPDAPPGPHVTSVVESAFEGRQRDTLPQHVTLTVTVPPKLFDNSINWQQANPFAIQMDADAWHAGHVTDILATDGTGLLVATDSGGVWSIATTGAALPLSDDWDNPDVNCLSLGPDGPNHFYAGCRGNGAIFESEPNTAFFGFINWHPIPLIDGAGRRLPTGAINRIAVLRSFRKLVLACDQGLFWAEIPTAGGQYRFNMASGAHPLTGRYEGLVGAANDSVIAAASGDGANSVGLYRGDWSTGELIMAFAPITGLTGATDTPLNPTEARRMFRTSVASCDSSPNIAYAVAARAGGDPWMYGVFKSIDAGATWRRVATRAQAETGPNTPFPLGTRLESSPEDGPNASGVDVAGGQGDYNNCIAVSPINPAIVAIGWRNGPWISRNGGTDWLRSHSEDENKHLHSDLHAVHFDQRDTSGRTLLVGSDGGIARTSDLGDTYVSQASSRLLNLQVGALSVTGRIASLASGALQDNGVIGCQLEPSPKPWLPLTGSDGQVADFAANGNLLFKSNVDMALRSSRWDGSTFGVSQNIPFRVSRPGIPSPAALFQPTVAVVESPHFVSPTTQQPMFAVACDAGSADVYGLFADDDGGNSGWQYVGTVPTDLARGQISALGSRNGHNVLVGTQDGRIFSLTPGSRSVLELFVVPRENDPGSVDHFLIENDSVAFAIYNASGQGWVLQLTPAGWLALGSGPAVATGRNLPTKEGDYTAIELDRTTSPSSVFLATDNHVYISRDLADTWQQASMGLPIRAHCTDLSFASLSSGAHYLYLSTYGRSIWRARLK